LGTWALLLTPKRSQRKKRARWIGAPSEDDPKKWSIYTREKAGRKSNGRQTFRTYLMLRGTRREKRREVIKRKSQRMRNVFKTLKWPSHKKELQNTRKMKASQHFVKRTPVYCSRKEFFLRRQNGGISGSFKTS